MLDSEVPARRKAIVVLGMHRSGTSAMARTLSISGAALPVQLMPPSPGNVTGYWEPQAVADFNDEVLLSLDSKWDDTFGPRRKGEKSPATDRFLQGAREIIRSDYGDHNLIVLKEPRINLLIELWQTALEMEGIYPVYVIMLRRPEEVAQSLDLRYGMDQAKVLLLWTTYMLTAESMTRNRRRTIVEFETLLREPEGVLDQIEDALGIELARRTRLSELETRRFLQGDLKHFNVAGTPHLPLAFRPVGELFDAFRAAANGSGGDLDLTADRVGGWMHSLGETTGSVIAAAEFIADRAQQRVAELEHAISAKHDELQALREQLSITSAEAEAARGVELGLRKLLLSAQHEANEARELASRLQGELEAVKSTQTKLQACSGNG